MNGTNSIFTQPTQLTQRQIELIDELSLLSKKFNFGHMFEGAINVLQNKLNPEALSQAAHSLRELMEKLDGIKGIPVTDKEAADGAGSLGDKARQLTDQWKKAKTKSKCLCTTPPSNEIDDPLRNLLNHISTFFDWFEKNPKFLAHKARGIVKGLDPLASMLPQEVQDAQAQEWKALKHYFIEVSHHKNGTTCEKMDATVAALERFLHIRIAPVKAQNQTAIEKLIREVEDQ